MSSLVSGTRQERLQANEYEKLENVCTIAVIINNSYCEDIIKL
jgi:hypothetical protein